MFAIVTIAGKQYKVAKGDIIDVDAVKGTVGDRLTLKDLSVISDKDTVNVGADELKNRKITAEITRQYRGPKIEVRRYKSKVRYRRHRGFRASRTQLKILSIS